MPIEPSLLTYRPLDAWVDEPINEDPWSALRASERLKVEKDRNGKTWDRKTNSGSEGQGNKSGPTTQAEKDEVKMVSSNLSQHFSRYHSQERLRATVVLVLRL